MALGFLAVLALGLGVWAMLPTGEEEAPVELQVLLTPVSYRAERDLRYRDWQRQFLRPSLRSRSTTASRAVASSSINGVLWSRTTM